MAFIRFRSRHLHATIVNEWARAMVDLNWVAPGPINFGAQPVTLMDYQPDERTQLIQKNTVAVSLGDYEDDVDEELGAKGGGLRSALYPVFFDVYMQEQALSIAMCDEIRDWFTDWTGPLVDQVNNVTVPGTNIEIEAIVGPDRPAANVNAEVFKRYWRIMRLEARLYFPS